MRAAVLAIASFVASALLFMLASFTGNIVARGVQPNGLAEVTLPYYMVSFIAGWASFGVLILGLVLSATAFSPGNANLTGRQFLGSGIFSAGVVAVVFSVLLYLLNSEDEGPRCLGGCAPSLLQYYQGVYVASTVLAGLGLIATGFGTWLLIHRGVGAISGQPQQEMKAGHRVSH